jgi:hypothetical protein
MFVTCFAKIFKTRYDERFTRRRGYRASNLNSIGSEIKRVCEAFGWLIEADDNEKRGESA